MAVEPPRRPGMQAQTERSPWEIVILYTTLSTGPHDTLPVEKPLPKGGSFYSNYVRLVDHGRAESNYGGAARRCRSLERTGSSLD
jgi:hypothetical protein